MAVVEGLQEEQFGVCWLIAGKRSAGAVLLLLLGEDIVRIVLRACFRVLC